MNAITQEDRARFAKMLGTLGIAFNRDVTNEILEVYSRLLLEFTIEELESAASRMLRDTGRKFFPNYPEFYAAIQGDPHAAATQALDVCNTATLKTGRYRSVSFEDSALMVTIEYLGGWEEVCKGVPDANLSYWEHNFRQIYTDVRRDMEKPDSPYLSGISERQNLLESGKFERGRLIEPEVDRYDKRGVMVRVPLKMIAPTAQPVELYEANVKALTEGNGEEDADSRR